MTTLPPGTSVGNARRPLLIVGLIVLVLVVGSAAWLLISRVLLRSAVDLTAQSAAAGATSVTVVVDNADVQVRPSTDGQVHVHATGSASGTDPVVTAAPSGSGIEVRAVCGGSWLSWCSLDVTVEMPAELPMTLNGDNGDVDVQGITAALSVYTDNGAITLDSPSGTVTAMSDNGRIEIDNSTATQLKIETDNGDVSVTNRVAPTSLTATTDNGSIELEIPGDQKYVLDTQTDNGTVDVKVGVDSDSPHRITATTDNGDISVRPIG